jgi:hypothetical protein
MGDQKDNIQKPGYGSSEPGKQHEGPERAGQSPQDKPGSQNPGDRASNPRPDQGEKNREGSTKPGGAGGSEADRSR